MLRLIPQYLQHVVPCNHTPACFCFCSTLQSLNTAVLNALLPAPLHASFHALLRPSHNHIQQLPANNRLLEEDGQEEVSTDPWVSGPGGSRGPKLKDLSYRLGRLGWVVPAVTGAVWGLRMSIGEFHW